MARDTGVSFWPWWPNSIFSMPSGDVIQDILRDWFSQKFEFNFAGNREIESEVIAKAGSYGRQLGLLTEVVLELAGDREGESIRRLKELNDEIEQIKRRHKTDLARDAKRALEALKSSDKDEYDRLIKAIQSD
jgi:methyl coenzyme M reductase subunit C-like uncharacterized protein (methanogenesis marker protein 7)